jgi:hypothetical protein
MKTKKIVAPKVLEGQSISTAERRRLLDDLLTKGEIEDNGKYIAHVIDFCDQVGLSWTLKSGYTLTISPEHHITRVVITSASIQTSHHTYLSLRVRALDGARYAYNVSTDNIWGLLRLLRAVGLEVDTTEAIDPHKLIKRGFYAKVIEQVYNDKVFKRLEV